jgi:hypothetical protein
MPEARKHRRSTPVHRLLAASAALLLSPSGVALAQAGSRQSATTAFDQQRPGQGTGVRLEIDYFNPSDPEAKPPAVQKVVTRLHAGSGIDTSVPALCTASDLELMASGAAACPTASRVGGGEIDLDTGLPGPARTLRNDVTLLNNTGQLIFLLESKSEPRSRFVARASIHGTTITSEVPPVPGGPPDGFTAIKRVRVGVRAISVGRGSSRRSYVTTPDSCPTSGTWTNEVEFTYRDGISQTVASQSPCRRSSKRPDRTAPRIRLGGVPRKRCVSRAFRARVRIAESSLRRATLSLDGRRLLATRKKRFSRRIHTRRLRPGRQRLTVVAIDNAGHRSIKRARFRTCRRPRIALTG